MEATTALIEQIRQISEQYRQEVPGGRRAWPKAIKSRVRELHATGMSYKEITKLTGISYFTMMGWHYRRSKGGTFQAVAIVRDQKTLGDAQNSTVAVEQRTHKKDANTVTVTLPHGMQLTGVTAEFMAELIHRLGSGA